MKHIATVAALLAAAAGAAHAQSSVTLFGVADAGIRSVHNSGVGSNTTMSSNGNSTSRFGFRGEEDLGGGLKAGFWLEAGLNLDGGTSDTTSGKLFNRRSTVSLMNNYGEVRLGRDYNPTGRAAFEFDPFGALGVGASTNVSRFSVAQSSLYLRGDNQVSYFLPSVAGLYGQVTFAPGESVNPTAPVGTNLSLARKYGGGRLGYKNGPLDVNIAYGKMDTTDVTAPTTVSSFKSTGVAGSYDFGMAKLISHYYRETQMTAKETRFLIGVSVPFGAQEFKASYIRTNDTNSAAPLTEGKASQFALGYVYNLSKRTALYSSAARISNKGAATYVISGGMPGITPGGSSTGYEVGLRTSF
jgi:predicted porin